MVGGGHNQHRDLCRQCFSQGPTVGSIEDELGTQFGEGPQATPPNPMVVVISGPSGVGKDAVVKRLLEVRPEIHFVVTCTSREKRQGEKEGVDYFFVTKNKFREMIDHNELLEHAVVYGEYKGIPKRQLREYMEQGKDVLLRLDVQGAATIRKILGDSAVYIFIVAESERGLVERLVERGSETHDQLLMRVANARKEVARSNEFEYVIENAAHQLDRSVSRICSILDAEKSRFHPKRPNIL
ncbi:hypothetical protein M758_3G064300 [Ceratodon purpureus]|nr:hypothetical protein M758_3G064300 [Ceratodon purpureus]